MSDHQDIDPSEVIKIYEGYGEYYLRLTEKYSDRLIQYAFVLNTGGLAILVGYLGAIRAICLNNFTKFAIASFLLGIIFNVIVVFLEKSRFFDLGKKLDNLIDQFKPNINTSKQLYESISLLKPKYSDKCVEVFESLSYIAFVVGLFMSIYILIK